MSNRKANIIFFMHFSVATIAAIALSLLTYSIEGEHTIENQRYFSPSGYFIVKSDTPIHVNAGSCSGEFALTQDEKYPSSEANRGPGATCSGVYYTISDLMLKPGRVEVHGVPEIELEAPYPKITYNYTSPINIRFFPVATTVLLIFTLWFGYTKLVRRSSKR